ncbi:MAG: alpha/beta hydrolase [Oscillospiraceae bacterium]|jgi:alpha-beta hydrolase superfamily lysophospholipase|nr:alpha/beta hydrolase [Oscillospiraceae bacterium]MCI9563907.1 alpha/beta hydrolase [Oscillospiraceae bacterium]
MAITSEFFFPSSDGKTLIHVNQWTPSERRILGVVQIAHGVAEYGARYAPFARFLCGHGFVVVANDHLGHGQSLIPGGPMVYLGEKDGWWNVVDDMECLRSRVAKVFPDRPYFLFGHSMGSFLSRTHLIRYPGRLDGCILCGTGHQSPALIAGGKLIADREIRRLGKKAFSARADDLAFGAYNKAFAPTRTRFDWVSASEENVDAYIADPLCGGDTTLGLFRDMLDGLSYITRQSNMDKMDADLPVFFIAGDQDPVGDMGKGVRKAHDCFKKAGIRDLSIKLYHGLRHEILNEASRQYVYRDVLDWLEARA